MKKKITDVEYETTKVAEMQEQLLYIGLERSWDHIRQGPSAAERNRPFC
jgi:hypothetical protein